MVINDQVDWRSLKDSLALDVTLIESVFYGLSKQYEKQQRDRQERLNKQPGWRDNNENQHGHGKQLDEMMFAKADVLIALENAEGYLDKRPWLRVLHTRLACVSYEKEGASLRDFVRCRQRDRTVCLRDMRRRLEVIYADATKSMHVEEKHKRFQAQARAVSPWCVREPKCLHFSPARQLYGVHVMPPKPVTEEELQAQRDRVTNHARAVVNAAVGVVMDKLLAPYTRPATTQSTGRRTGRHQVRADGDPSKANSSQRRAKRDEAERELQLRALRLELLAPTANFSSLQKTDDGIELKEKKKDEIMLMLATVEAQGDARLACKMLDHGIVQSGFRRAAEQAKRLGITAQPWKVVKLWRDLYRTSTLHALGST